MTSHDKLLRDLVISIFGSQSSAGSDTAGIACQFHVDAARQLHRRYCGAACSRLPSMLEHITGVLTGSPDEGAHDVLLFAVSCLRAFRIANSCGRDTGLPDSPFHHVQEQPSASSCSRGAAQEFCPNTWAMQQLSADGEDPVRPVTLPQYLVTALAILTHPLGLRLLSADSTAPQCQAMSPGTPVATLSDSPAEAAIQSAIRSADAAHPGLAWWAARAVHLQQRLLAKNSLSLQRALLHLLAVATNPLDPALLAPLCPLVAAPSSDPQPPTCDGAALASAMRAAVRVEACYVWLDFRHVSLAKAHLAAAAQALQLRVSTSGAMGTRTEAQVDAKAQLILQVDHGDATTRFGALGSGGDVAKDVWPQAEQPEGSAWAGWEDDSGVRHVPRLRGPAGQMPELAPLEQAVVLAQATVGRRGAAHAPEAADWLLAPYVEALLTQPRTRHAIAVCTLLMRVRHELRRARVRERGLLALQAMYDHLQAAQLQEGQLEALVYTTPVPLHAEFRAEAAATWLKAGQLAQAMDEFEALEDWEKLIGCFMVSGKAAAAESLLQRRLEVDGDNPRLLCAMGELTHQVSWFERAWDASGHKHAPSQRALGQVALSKKQHAEAAGHYQLAVGRNALDAESWFALGYCELKRGPGREGHAAVAFTRCVQADLSHGEAWNNLGALHLAAGRYAPAFKAMQVSLKHNRETWQVRHTQNNQIKARPGHRELRLPVFLRLPQRQPPPQRVALLPALCRVVSLHMV
eukprot:jgi/Ulvmu1/540/UM001_0548.1